MLIEGNYYARKDVKILFKSYVSGQQSHLVVG